MYNYKFYYFIKNWKELDKFQSLKISMKKKILTALVACTKKLLKINIERTYCSHTKLNENTFMTRYLIY